MRFIARLPITLALVGLAWLAPVSAAVFTVDTTADDITKSACDDNVAADCSLRGAIVHANGLSEASTILVPAGTYSLTSNAPCNFKTHQFGTFPLNTVSLCFSANVTLVGAGADTTIIDANRVDRVVAVSDYTVEIRDVTLRNGTTQTAGSFDGVLQGGGGINNGGTLTLVDSVVSGNSAALDGGGIFNGHTLFIIRSKILGNTSAGGGGGITNESYFEVTALSIQDSTIADNIAATRDGGGIFNFGGAIAIAGSTISGNQAAGLGGGIENINNSAAIQIVNSTISGNSSGSAGGGIEVHSGTLALNNVTITNNTSATNHTGEGGGIAMAVPVTASNTIIAGNHDANGGAPDCSGTIASAGYNLIQTTKELFRGFLVTSCNVNGDTTGNIIGQDPLLGALADNGGPTSTHALGMGSPATDAGNPASPGSGAASCAVADQRTLLRPLGSRCDMGAVERNGAFSLASVTPSAGGNTGPVTVSVAGSGFVQGATLKLRRSGRPDITATPQVDVGGSDLIASVDLAGVAPGVFDVVVTNPDLSTRTLTGAFTVRTGVGPDLWVDVIGMLRRHGPSFVTVMYGNRGDVDALAVPLTISVPDGYQATARFNVTPPEGEADDIRPDWSTASIILRDDAATLLSVPLLLSVVPSGYTGVLRFTLTLTPTSAPSAAAVVIGTPAYTNGPDTAFVTNAALGAQTLLQQAFGFALPPSALPETQQYAANELQRIVTAGQSAFAATIGMNPSIYSLAQFQLNLAFQGARRAAGQ